MCSVLLRYALTDQLLSLTSLPADPRQASLLGCSDLHGNGSQIPFRKLAVRFESLLLSFYWEHRLLKLLLLFGIYFYYNKIHSHCRAGIIVKHIQTSVCFRCSSVVIKTSNLSGTQTIVKSFLEYETGGRMHKALPRQDLPSL